MADLVIDGTPRTKPAGDDWGQWASAMLANSQWRHVEMFGHRETEHGLNLTSRRQGVVVDAKRLILSAEGCTNIVDLTDSTGVQWWGGRFEGGSGVGCGILSGDCEEHNSRAAGKHAFWGVSVVGRFDSAAVATVAGGESSRWFAPRAENADGIWRALRALCRALRHQQ